MSSLQAPHSPQTCQTRYFESMIEKSRPAAHEGPLRHGGSKYSYESPGCALNTCEELKQSYLAYAIRQVTPLSKLSVTNAAVSGTTDCSSSSTISFTSFVLSAEMHDRSRYLTFNIPEFVIRTEESNYVPSAQVRRSAPSSA